MTLIFAKVDKSNVVVDLIVVSESDSKTPAGDHDEAIGRSFLESVLGEGVYLETRYDDATFSRSVARIGGGYDPARDIFTPPDPEDGSVYDPATNTWVAP